MDSIPFCSFHFVRMSFFAHICISSEKANGNFILEGTFIYKVFLYFKERILNQSYIGPFLHFLQDERKRDL